MLGTLFFASCFSAACKDQQRNTIILEGQQQFQSLVECILAPPRRSARELHACSFEPCHIFLRFHTVRHILGRTAAVLPCL